MEVKIEDLVKNEKTDVFRILSPAVAGIKSEPGAFQYKVFKTLGKLGRYSKIIH